MKNPSYNVATLLNGFAAWPAKYPVTIQGLSTDSRTTQAGDLFIACGGPAAERPQFIAQAIENGAVAVLTQAADTPQMQIITTMGRDVPCFAIPQLQQQLGHIAARFFGNSGDDLHVIGITGTNGKTSCCQFIASMLNQAGLRCATIGTLGAGFPNNITPGALTTPGAIELQQTLATLKQRGAVRLAMEVSSHGLAQHRVTGIPFEIAVFTNLTRDHLDYHGDMAHYGQAKRLLFLTPSLKYAVINADDDFGQTLLAEFAPRLSCYAYTTKKAATHVPTVTAENLQFHTDGFVASLHTPWGEGKLRSKLLGRFNLHNLLAAVTTLGILQIPLPDILHYLATLSTVPGRMQRFGDGKTQPLVVVDYAHTPDALEKALTALREHCQGKLWCVFGCGGNRDAGKRPLMARVAQTYSDYVVVTDDNPRFEDSKQIIADIVAGFLHPETVHVEHDRQKAIAYAILQAHINDIVLVAGKGHEPYQQIGAVKIPFSDAEQVTLQLNARKNRT